MYAGRVVEQGGISSIFERPRHPYTKGLLRGLPRKETPKKAELPTIEGIVPSLLHPPAHCRFADRCWQAKRLKPEDRQRCFTEDPQLRPAENGLAACHFPATGDEP